MASWDVIDSTSSFSVASKHPKPSLKYLQRVIYFSRNFSATPDREAAVISSWHSSCGHVFKDWRQRLHSKCQFLHCITGGKTTFWHTRHSIFLNEVPCFWVADVFPIVTSVILKKSWFIKVVFLILCIFEYDFKFLTNW